MINFQEKSIKHKRHFSYRVLILQALNLEKIVCIKYNVSFAETENYFNFNFYLYFHIETKIVCISVD